VLADLAVRVHYNLLRQSLQENPLLPLIKTRIQISHSCHQSNCRVEIIQMKSNLALQFGWSQFKMTEFLLLFPSKLVMSFLTHFAGDEQPS
jgi:hypothetical protein